ncbi:hypothetical protein [Lacticaseibacillus daqingensis]|uniref:hypothetical protein n=1 Tax=Lacticaseibacillus daqingensis TaxID=2486014 RepID=UPI000F78DCB3|nr:hypothetical protein [Lacticaseibacillus daqingensis]
MTNFGQLTAQLSHQRLRQAGQALGLWGLTTVVAVVIGLLTHGLAHTDWPTTLILFGLGFSLFASVILIVWFAQATERLWGSAQYRLLPIGNGRLITANGVALTPGLVAYWAGVAVCITVAILVTGTTQFHFDTTWADMVQLIVLWVVLHLFVWAFITMVHLLINTIRLFLPERQGRWVTRGLSLLVVVLSVWAMNSLIHLLSAPFDGLLLSPTLSTNASYLIGTGCYVLLIALMTALNVLLLNRFVEPA